MAATVARLYAVTFAPSIFSSPRSSRATSTAECAQPSSRAKYPSQLSLAQLASSNYSSMSRRPTVWDSSASIASGTIPIARLTGPLNAIERETL